MQFQNESPFPALNFENIDQHGVAFNVAVVRQTFRLVDGILVVADVQQPIRDSDLHEDGGTSGAVRQESDLCPYKPRCDVIVNAVATAPGAVAARRFNVRLVVESWEGQQNVSDRAGEVGKPNAAPQYLIDKTLVIHGPRRLVPYLLPLRFAIAIISVASFGAFQLPRWRLSRSDRFVSLPLDYDYTFGGSCRIDEAAAGRDYQIRKLGRKNCLTQEELTLHPDAVDTSKTLPIAHAVCEHNPYGTGFMTSWYLRNLKRKTMSAPRIERPTDPFTNSLFWKAMNGRRIQPPAGMRVVGRNWLPRRSLVGAFKAKAEWSEDEVPSLPIDFDYGYWNCAPSDQQCRHLHGNETITLINLTAPDAARNTGKVVDTVLKFDLPGITPFIVMIDERGCLSAKLCLLDTVYIDAVAGCVELVWRVTAPVSLSITAMRLRVASSEEEALRLAAFIGLQQTAHLTEALREPSHAG